MNIKVGLTYDLRQDYLARGYAPEDVAEFDSEATIAALEDALRTAGYEPERIGNAQALCQRLVAGQRWDLVFNIAEGLRGRSREAQVPCLLELYEIPYTFSDPLVCAVTLDKAVAKRLVQAAGLHTARFAVVDCEADLAHLTLEYPLFAKPLAEGTGKGVDETSRITSPAELARVVGMLLRRFQQPVLVEEYLPGREFTVGVLGTGRAARVLGTLEVCIRPAANSSVYSYKVKERCEELVDYRPCEPGPLLDAVEELACRAYRVLELRDAGRVDVRLDRHGRPAFLEANALPGMHPQHSDLPMIATQQRLPYHELVGRIVASALERRSPSV